ncbi:MAG: class I SAM-dependent methyltransferase [bacterium]
MCADWNQLFQDPGKVIREPDPLLGEFLQVMPREARVLDLGCGAGRHLLPLAKANLRVTGSDIAPVGLQFARSWLASEQLSVDLVSAEMTALPLAGAVFDGVISINVLNHGRIADTQASVREVRRLLKRESPFFFVIIGREDVRCGEGEEIEPFTFIPRLGIEAGVPHHYYDYDEILHLVEGFSRFSVRERRIPFDEKHPVFGNDPRAKGKINAISHHWEVKVWT